VTRTILTLAAVLPLVATAAGVSIQLDAGAFQVSGVAGGEPVQGWASAFSVYAGEGDVPQMTGTYSRSGELLRFQPRYPLTSGVQYRAVFHPLGEQAVEARFDGPKSIVGPSTRLERVYPSTDVLPANQLKLYLEFSQPMSRGGIWSHIHLVRDDGKAVELPFLEIDQELWTRDQRRLTVLFDPGRIKRGVTPQQEMGEVLEAGRSYTLIVDREMSDARNQPLAEAFRRQFRVAPSLREGIDPKKWKLTATRESFTVEFDRPLDWALLQHTFHVNGIEGTASIDRDETRWRFTPTRPFKPGHYELVIDMALEDLAGNRIGRPFDVDLFERVTERITTETTTLGFTVQ
jgi:hypothetical protein